MARNGDVNCPQILSKLTPLEYILRSIKIIHKYFLNETKGEINRVIGN